MLCCTLLYCSFSIWYKNKNSSYFPSFILLLTHFPSPVIFYRQTNSGDSEFDCHRFTGFYFKIKLAASMRMCVCNGQNKVWHFNRTYSAFIHPLAQRGQEITSQKQRPRDQNNSFRLTCFRDYFIYVIFYCDSLLSTTTVKDRIAVNYNNAGPNTCNMNYIKYFFLLRRRNDSSFAGSKLWEFPRVVCNNLTNCNHL